MRPRERTAPELVNLVEGGLPLFRIVLVILLSTATVGASDASAQRAPGSAGLGLQIGRPGGLAVKVYRSQIHAYDAVLTTDADDFVAGYIHRLWEVPVPNSPLHVYAGPGIQVGAERLDRSPRLRLGLSSEVGLNFYAERFEVFLHVTPTLRFFPNTEASLDGNVGLRYYFGI